MCLLNPRMTDLYVPVICWEMREAQLLCLLLDLEPYGQIYYMVLALIDHVIVVLVPSDT